MLLTLDREYLNTGSQGGGWSSRGRKPQRLSGMSAAPCYHHLSSAIRLLLCNCWSFIKYHVDSRSAHMRDTGFTSSCMSYSPLLVSFDKVSSTRFPQWRTQTKPVKGAINTRSAMVFWLQSFKVCAKRGKYTSKPILVPKRRFLSVSWKFYSVVQSSSHRI